MVSNPFAARPAQRAADVPPVERVAARAFAADARASADARRAAKRSGEAAREAAADAIERNARDLERAVAALRGFDAATVALLAAELDSPDPITQHSTRGRAATADAGLPGWLRERCLSPDAGRVVLDWLSFGPVFAAHREFSARAGDDPLGQVYEALSLGAAESLAVEGVATVGREACERILHVAFALRAAQRAGAARGIRSVSGYAAADAWRAFDRVNRFLTPALAEWLVLELPSDERVAAVIVSGRFRVDESTPAGRSIGIAPGDIDEAAFAAELRRSR